MTALRETKFSVIPDETTDVATEKQLGIVARHFDSEKMDIVTCFLDPISVENNTDTGLYGAIKETLLENGMPLHNIIGYSPDTANVMFCDKVSVVSVLKIDHPHIVTVICSCHLIQKICN